MRNKLTSLKEYAYTVELEELRSTDRREVYSELPTMEGVKNAIAKEWGRSVEEIGDLRKLATRARLLHDKNISRLSVNDIICFSWL